MSETVEIPERRLVSIETIVAETEISKTTVFRLINAGTLERVKIGASTRITGASYRRFLEALNVRF